MIVIKCDRCKKELPKDGIDNVVGKLKVTETSVPRDINRKYDFCKNCAKDLVAFIKNSK